MSRPATNFDRVQGPFKRLFIKFVLIWLKSTTKYPPQNKVIRTDELNSVIVAAETKTRVCRLTTDRPDFDHWEWLSPGIQRE